jgi:hypothetical protein
MEIRPVGAKVFHVDGRIDTHDDGKVACSNFPKAPSNDLIRTAQ